MALGKTPLKTQKRCLLIIFHLKKFLSILAFPLTKCKNLRNNSPPPRKHNRIKKTAASGKRQAAERSPCD